MRRPRHHRPGADPTADVARGRAPDPAAATDPTPPAPPAAAHPLPGHADGAAASGDVGAEPAAAVVRRHTDAYNNADLDGLLRCYAADATVETGGAAVVVAGHPALRRYYAAVFAGASVQVTVVGETHTGRLVAQAQRVTSGDVDPVDGLAVFTVDGGLITRVMLLRA